MNDRSGPLSTSKCSEPIPHNVVNGSGSNTVGYGSQAPHKVAVGSLTIDRPTLSKAEELAEQLTEEQHWHTKVIAADGTVVSEYWP